jgi:hypothetical protein
VVPPQLASFVPTTTDPITTKVTLLAVEGAADYDAIRARPQWILTQPLVAAYAGDAALAYAVDFLADQHATEQRLLRAGSTPATATPWVVDSRSWR